MIESVDLKTLTDEQKAFLNGLAYLNLDFEDIDIINNNGNITIEYLLTKYGESFAKEDKEIIESIQNNNNLKKLEIVGYENNNSDSGFAAIAFKDTEGNTGISFRGSENKSHGQHWLVDMWDNFKTAVFGNSQQSREAAMFFERYQNTEGDNYLFGHSKGGELATKVYVRNEENVQGVTVINAQPINIFQLTPKEIEALYLKKFDSIIVNGDFVSGLGYNLYPSRYVENNGKDDSYTGPHSYWAMKVDKDGYAVPLDMKNLVDYPLQGVTKVFGTYLLGTMQFRYASINLPAKLIYTIGYYTNKGIDIAVNELMDVTKKALIAFGNYSEPAIRAFGNFYAEVISTLKIVKRQILIISGKSVATPYINVNTNSLRNYADRLEKVKSRLAELDSDMTSLIFTESLPAVISAIRANNFPSQRKIQKCINYLDGTAEAFERAERNILNRV